MKTLTRQELLDILYGATVLGTGGGGSLEEGIKRIEDALAQGKEFRLVDVDELDPEDLIATPYGCGAISPDTPEELAKYAHLTELEELSEVVAIERMEEFLGRPIRAVTSTELGGGNTAVSLYVGAMSGRLILDADAAGRSVPDLQLSTYYLHDIPIYPMSLVNDFGESAIITYVQDDLRAEAIVRAMAVASRNSIGVVDHVQPARILRDAVIRGAITDAQELGRVFREAKAAGQDIVAAMAASQGGKVVAKGVVTANEWDTVAGFTVGVMTIQAGGDEYRVSYKNENMIAWRNGSYLATIPDLICVFNEDAAMPLLNPYAEPGMNVTLFVLPAPAEWTTPKGLETFGPRSVGEDLDWTPFC
jgi:DUF917 family protein